MQKIAGHILILWMALFVIPNHLFASVVNFNGEVVDEKGLPLPSVVVFVEGTTHGAFTDGNGYFSFDYELGSSEKICLRFSIVGFQEEVRCVSHGMTSLKVVMKERTEELEQQEVNAIRKQDDYLQRLEMSGMKNIPDAGGGAIESLLATQAGVSMNNELSSQYSVRGGNYDENCVYVNSIEIHRPLLIRSGEQEGLSFVNPNMVESVSFSSGGFGVEYGDRMASVLDIRYKRPSKLEGSAFVSLMGASAYVGQSTGKFSQMHGVRFKKSRLLLSSLDTDADYNPNFLDYQTHVTYDVSEKFRLSFLANISRNDYLYEPHSREASFGTLTDTKNIRIGFVGREQDLFVTYFGSLSLDYNPTEKTKLSLTTSDFHTSENVSYDITSSYWIGNQLTKEYALGTSTTHEHARNDLNATVANLSLLGETKFNFNTIKWGVSYRREIIDEFVNEWEMHDSAGYFIPMNNQFLMMYDNLNSKKKLKTNRFSAYLQETYTKKGVKGKVVVNGGVRVAYWNFNDEWLVSPRISASFFPEKHPNWGLRVATGIYQQALFYKELKQIVTDEKGNSTLSLNKEIKSPRSYQLFLGSDYYFKVKERPFKLTTEIYGKYIDRIIPYEVNNTEITYWGENCADGFAVGSDFKIFGEFVPGTDSWLSFSLMRTMEDLYDDNRGYIYRPTDQLYNVSLFLQDYVPGYDKLKFNLKFIWAQGFPAGYPGVRELKAAARLSSYRRVDLGIIYHLRKGVDKVMERKMFSWMKVFSVNVDLFNLLNIKNENSYYWVESMTDGGFLAVPNYLTGFRPNVKIQVDF